MRKIKKIIAVFLCIFCVMPIVAGCAGSGKKLLTLEGNSISENIFMYYLSKMKAEYGAYVTDDYWDTVMTGNGKTYGDALKEQVLFNVKLYLAAVCLFDELGLKLDKSEYAEIDEIIDGYIADDANGSKSEFNSILEKYGINVKILREIMIMESKINYLKEYLYGTDGSKVGAGIIEEYYNENYARFKHVFIQTYEIIYKTDRFGNAIRYNSDGSVAYDTANGKTKKNESGNYYVDDNGDNEYFNDEGVIVYSTAGSREVLRDDSGNVITQDYSTEKILEKKERAQEIFATLEKGDYLIFNSYVAGDDNQDEALKNGYVNGYYVTKETDYEAPEVIKALFTMEVGEVKMVQSELGYHVVMRYENEEGGYALEANEDFFINVQTGQNVFMEDIVNTLYTERLTEYAVNIKVDTTLYEGIDIKNLGENYYY